MSLWKLDEGLELIRLLQPKTRDFGYHLTLGGGVLNKGESNKDLDLFFLPLDNASVAVDAEGLLRWLQGLWGDYEGLRAPDGYPDAVQPSSNWVTVDINGRRQAIPIRPVSFSYSGVTDHPKSPFAYKVKFLFSGTHRIDVFIHKGPE